MRQWRQISCLYIVATRKTRYVSKNYKGLGCGLDKGKMRRLICFREQSKIGRNVPIWRHQSARIEPCGDYCVDTKENLVEILYFRHFAKHFMFTSESEKIRNKHLKNYFAPAATKTEFGKIANDISEYDYDRLFGTYHTSTQMAAFLLELYYDSDKTVGFVDREFSFHLFEPQFQYAGSSRHNQKM